MNPDTASVTDRLDAFEVTKLIETEGENTTENLGRHKRIILEHSFYKGLQYGGIAGLVCLPPYYYFYRRFHYFHLFSRLNTTAGLTAGTFGVAAAIGAAVRMRSLSQDEIYDRAYRLNRNRFNNFCDVGGATFALFVCSGTTLGGYSFLYKPHYGHDVPKDIYPKRLARGMLAGMWAWGPAYLLALYLGKFVRPILERQKGDGMTDEERYNAEFIDSLVEGHSSGFHSNSDEDDS